MMKHYKREIERVMDEAVASGQVPCASVALYRHGEEKLRYVSGMADREANRALAEDTIFRLYSLTKPMTAVAALSMIERGRLDLLAPVKDFLPGFTNQQVAVGDRLVPVNRDIVIRDLLSMTAGLVYPGDATVPERAMADVFADWMRKRAEGNAPTTQELCNAMGRAPLAFQPGEGWMYSVCADIVGAVLEIVSGKKLDALLRELLFEPLGMKDTGFYVPTEKLERLATLYSRRDGTLRPFPEMHLAVGDYSVPPHFLSGGAGLVSTLDDVLRFARMLLGGGTLDGERILSERSVDYIRHDHLSPKQHAACLWDSMPGYGYGAFVRVLQNQGESFSLGEVGEYGWDGWTGPYMTVCPAQDMVLVVMQQITDSGTNALTRAIRNIVYAHLDVED